METKLQAKSGKEPGTLVNFDMSFYLTLIFESQLCFEQCTSFYIGIEISHYPIPSVLYLLELHKLSASHRGLLSIVKTLRIIAGYTPWFPTLLKYTTNLPDCLVHMDVTSTKTDLDTMYKALSSLPHLKGLVLFTTPCFTHRFDIINLLKFLTEKNVYLTESHLAGFQYDVKVMARYLSSRGASMCYLGLVGLPDSYGQPTTINEVIEKLPSLKNLHSLSLLHFQISGVIKYLSLYSFTAGNVTHFKVRIS